MKADENKRIDSLTALRKKLALLHRDIDKQEEHISKLWSGLFYDEARAKRKRTASPVGRALLMAADAAEPFDGLLLGWRLYHRFLGTASLFKRKKKKH